MSGLHYLRTGDPQIEAVVQKVQRVLNRDIPLLILGETGTGKELLARAVHQDSNRAKQPFVAVNCASIPESLIEAELFGYEDGAFTGARRKGACGRIVQANGGTLFLDEIGDMPLALQARLLRVLQERCVTPLGSQKSISVDIAVIGATHRNLREMIEAGTFREDLYYRLNGLVVRLPALRERRDLDIVAQRILLAECPQGTPHDRARRGRALRPLRVARQHPPARQRAANRRRDGGGRGADHRAPSVRRLPRGRAAASCTPGGHAAGPPDRSAGSAPGRAFDAGGCAGIRHATGGHCVAPQPSLAPEGAAARTLEEAEIEMIRAAVAAAQRQHLRRLQASGHQPQHHLPQAALEVNPTPVSAHFV